LPPAFYTVPHAGWNYGIVSSDAVFITQTWTNLMHAYIGKKQMLVFLKHAHFAVTTVLSNVAYVVIIFFQQNKLTITLNKMITAGKSD